MSFRVSLKSACRKLRGEVFRSLAFVSLDCCPVVFCGVTDVLSQTVLLALKLK